MMLGNKIAELRKEKGITQEALANTLRVSNQAVSKWEANQSCPDILLLPQIADFFDVSLDYLFDREKNQSEKIVMSQNYNSGINRQGKPEEGYHLPWEDDGMLRAVIYIGHNLVQAVDCTEASEITFTYEGEALDIVSNFSVNCNNVEGDIIAYGNVTCDYVEGDIDAKGNVICDHVEGDVVAGGSVTCDGVEGDIEAGGCVTCGEVNGNLNVGGSVTCDEINGNVCAGGDIIFK